VQLLFNDDSSGNITANVTNSSPYITFINQSNILTNSEAYQWYNIDAGTSKSYGQYLPSLNAGNITSVSFWMWKRTGGIGVPPSTANVSVRRANDLALIGTLGTIDPSTVAGDGTFDQGDGAWYTFSTVVNNPIKQDIIITMEFTSVLVDMPAIPNYILFPLPQTNIIYGIKGEGTTGISFNTTSSLGGYDMGFRMTFSGNNTNSVVTASNTANGLRNVSLLNRDGGLEIYVDGVIKDATYGTNMTSSANDWLWLERIPYADSISYSVSGTQQLYYSPNTIISNTTLPDRSSDITDNPGTITWGTNPSNIVISIGGITSFNPTTSGIISGVSGTVDTLQQPTKWFGNGAFTGVLTPELREVITSAATSTGIQEQALYVLLILGVATAIGLSVLLFTGSPLMMIITVGVILMAGVNTNILSGWFMAVYLMIVIPILYLSRQG